MTNKTVPQTKAPPTLATFFILWAALLASQSMIVFVAQAAMTHPAVATGGEAPASQFAALGVPLELFGVVAAVLAAAAYLAPRFMLREPRRQMLAQADVPLKVVAEKVLPAWIVRWVLLEAVTMVGFMASALYALPTIIYPFAAVSLVGFALTFPSEEKIRAGV